VTDAGAILSYLAALAPGGSTRRTVVTARRSDLAYLGWVDPSMVFHGGGSERPPIVEATERLRSLSALDRLHADEHLLRVGWLWTAGTVDGDRHLFPVLSARAELQRERKGFRVVALADPEVTPGLVEPAVAEVLEDALGSLFTLAGPAEPTASLAAGYPAARSWLNEYFGAADLPRPRVVPVSNDPWKLSDREELLLVLGVGCYLARDVDAATIRADLTAWSKLDLSGSAFEAIYLGSSVAAADTGSGGPIESAYPLNDAQREAIGRSRVEQIVVVSGPPGTGKSHLAAALAVDEVARGHSVLMAAQTEQAVDVIADLLGRYPGPRWVRFGRREHRRRVADDLAGGMAVPYSGADVDRLEGRLDDARGRRARVRHRIIGKLEDELALTRGLADRQQMAADGWAVPGVAEAGFDVARAERMLARARDDGGPFGSWFRERAERKMRARLGVHPDATLDDVAAALRLARAEAAVRNGLRGGGTTLDTEWEELVRAEAAWREELGRVVEARRRSRENRRSASARSVSALASALRAGKTKRRRALQDLRAGGFLDVLPLWVGTLKEIDDTLPKEPAVFDVVIFDEGSQIDQLRAAPALARARRAVVIGDPKQLRHVSFLSDDAMAASADEHGIEAETLRILDVRRNSLFDVAVGASAVSALREHFRSVPHIIGFSDRRFYDGTLKLMTQHPATERLDAIRIRRVRGSRDDEGVNGAEIDAVVEEVAAVVDRGGSSIGVMSPFRAQADALEEALVDRFHPDALEAADVRVGTVHAFQGNERDVIVVSLGVSVADVSGSLRFIEEPHLFNVMVTRARHEMVVVTSLGAGEEGAGLLADYVRWAAEPPLPSRGAAPARGWVGSLARELEAFGLPVVASYPVAGYEVDLAVGAGAAAIGVECEVFEADPRRHIERHMDLVRAGWRLADMFQSRWLAMPEEAAERLAEVVLRPDGSDQIDPNRPGGQ